MNLLTLFFLFICIPGACFTLSASEIAGSLPILVRNAGTHLPIPKVRICTNSEVTCVESDSTGTAEFTRLKPGRYEIVVSAAGYITTVERNVSIHQGLNYQLIVDMEKEHAVNLDKMTVTARRSAPKKASQSTSTTRITAFELSNTPGTANDISRVIATYPGVVSSAGFVDDNTMYVRGGTANENVFIIDGIEMDNANHFSDFNTSGGAMCFLNGSLVRELEFYSGGFPATFPPRLSSVIDMQLRTGSFTDYKLEADANMSGIGITAEGPLSPRLSFLTSGRMVDITLLDRFFDMDGTSRFGDGVLKLVFLPNENHTIKLLSLGAIDNYHEKYDADEFSFPTSYDEWIYQGGGIADWTFSNARIKNSLSFSGSLRKELHYDEAITTTDATTPDTFIYNVSEYNRTTMIIDSLVFPDDTMYLELSRYRKARLWENNDLVMRLTAKEQFTLFLRDNDRVSSGFSLSSNSYRIAKNDASQSSGKQLFMVDGEQVVEPLYSWKPNAIDSTMEVRHIGGYTEYVFYQGWIKCIAGLRADYYTVLTDYGISPRLGLQLQPGTVGTFSLSGGRYYQFPSDFLDLFNDIVSLKQNPENSTYSPSLNDVRLQRNWQGVFRYERSLGERHLLSVESYYKLYDREYPLISPDNRRYYNVTDDGVVWLFDKPNGKKKAYGAEIFFRKTSFDRWYYSLSCSFFSVKNRYVDGRWYDDVNNLGTTVGLTLGSNFAKNHGVALRLAAAGGRPYSAINMISTRDGFTYDRTRDYFSERLDPVVSASLRYSFSLDRTWGNITGYLEVWNLFNQTPVIERYFSSRSGYRDFSPTGILPIAGVKVNL